jgi:protein-S-isoprenylcysteine O-methyltransferase Ste14
LSLNEFLRILRQIAAIATISTLAIAITASLVSLRHPPVREDPRGRIFLRIPFILLASVLFIILIVLGWKPLPIQPSFGLLLLFSLIGAVSLFLGLAFYLGGLIALRGMFATSSGFAVRIQADQRLMTTGPYALVRHPMYLGVILASIGILLLFWTWTGLVLSITMFGLTVRARREERLLADQFGPEWQIFASRTPMWIPGARSRNQGGA